MLGDFHVYKKGFVHPSSRRAPCRLRIVTKPKFPTGGDIYTVCHSIPLHIWYNFQLLVVTVITTASLY